MKQGSTTLPVTVIDAALANDRSRADTGTFRRPSAATQIRLVASREFGDRFRSGWVITCVLVWLGAIGLTSFFGLMQAGRIGVQGYERTTISLLNLVQYLVPLLGLLLSHDLIVGEAEEKTLRLVVAGGVSRARLLFGKLVGGVLTLAVPLLLGFAVAGTIIGFAARDAAVGPFLRLAASGLVLGIIFLGIGLAISSFSRSRVQSLVFALLVWCCAVFVFDLVALGVTLSTQAPAASEQIDILCDPMHLNAAVDIHSDFDPGKEPSGRAAAVAPEPGIGWLAINPLDLFRGLNLAAQTGVSIPWPTLLAAVTLWLVGPFLASLYKFRRNDL